MFKLLAIRPLEGCADYIQKCLKTGMMYYFCNDYIIEPGSHIRRRSKNIKPLKEDFFTVVSESDYSEDNSSERKSPTVSVSAIVGMNGDGKSTLVELMMRLINNCAISYELCASSDNSKGKKGNKTEPHYNLRRVENAKAELYYMIDNVVYRMAEEKDQKDTRIWKVLELNPFNEKGEELMRWEIDSVEIQKVEDDPKGFFFTIVSNYSHYAYNIYDFEKEWEIRGGEKDDDEKCWLHYVFHKNDGYLTPITLHPCRDKGNININNEKYLSKQRLLSLFLNADNPYKDKKSFRNVNGKYANILKLTEERESKLQQKAIIEYFQVTSQENRFISVLNVIDNIEKEIDQAALFYESDYCFIEEYRRLVNSIMPMQLVNPLKDIIAQEDFGSFVREVVSWLKNVNVIKYLSYGDIGTVVKRYNNLKKKRRQFVKAQTYNSEGMEYDVKGEAKMALDKYDKAIELVPNYVGAYINRGDLKFRNGDKIGAIRDFDKSIELNPEYIDAYLFRGYVNSKSDANSALLDYNRAIEIDPEYTDAYYYRGNLESDLGDYYKALRDYDKAIELAPDNAKVYFHRGNLRYKIGNKEGALSDYNNAIDIKADYIEAYRERGDVKRELGDIKGANIDYRAASSLFKRNFDYNIDDFRYVSCRLQDAKLIDDNDKKWEEVKMNEKEFEWLDTIKYKHLNRISAVQLGRLDTLYRIIKSYNRVFYIDPIIVTKYYSELSLEKKCHHYIIYKTWSILSKYPQFHDAFMKGDDDKSFRECGAALEKYVDLIQKDDSHFTRKLRQVKNFMNEKLHEGGLYERLGKRNERKRGDLLVKIDKLKEHYGGKPIPLDNLPPPIYKWDIVFQKNDDANCEIEYDSFSSGEKQLLNSIGAIIYHLQNLVNTSSGIKYYNVNLVLEEIELYYHPEYQRLFLIRLLDSIRRAKLGNMKNINIVFVTHSPFILSDIPKCNVLFLKDGMPKDIMQENTFGANVHTLLKNGFFMPNLPIGEFAYGKINNLFGKLNSGELDPNNDLDDIYQEILLVGEPFLRNQLLMLYNSYKGSRVMPMNTNKKGT